MFNLTECYSGKKVQTIVVPCRIQKIILVPNEKVQSTMVPNGIFLKYLREKVYECRDRLKGGERWWRKLPFLDKVKVYRLKRHILIRKICRLKRDGGNIL